MSDPLCAGTAACPDKASSQATLASDPKGGKVPDSATAHLDAAVDQLRLQQGRGGSDTVGLKTDTAFDPLRKAPDFQALIEDMSFPADPFAR